MHVKLVDYHYGGLDYEEMLVVEQWVAADQQARHLMEQIQEKFFAPLEADRCHVDAPHGLAQRTCQCLWRRSES